MTKKILALAGGIISLLLLFRLTKSASKPLPINKEKRKQKDEPQEQPLSGLIGCSLVMILLGVMFLAMATLGAVDTLKEYRTLKWLKASGEIHHVPLISLEHEVKDSYRLRYRFNGSIHEETVGNAEYKRLRHHDTVEIIAVGNVSRLAGTKIGYNTLISIVFLAVFGSLWISATVVQLVEQGKQILTHRGKRKRGLPEV